MRVRAVAGAATDYSSVLADISPFAWGELGVAMGLGLSIVGAAWGIFVTGSTLVGAAVKAPRIRSKNLIRSVAGAQGSRAAPASNTAAAPPHSVIFCEATAIYGVIIGIVLASKVRAALVPPQPGSPRTSCWRKRRAAAPTRSAPCLPLTAPYRDAQVGPSDDYKTMIENSASLYWSAFAILAAGVGVGLTNVASGYVLRLWPPQWAAL